MIMKSTVIVCKTLAVILSLSVCEGRRKNFTKVKVRTTAYDFVEKEAYFKIPTCTSDPDMKTYCNVPSESDYRFKHVIDFYCLPDDPRVCLMFDKKGYIVGIQISFLKCDVANVPPEVFDYSAIKDFEHTNFFGMPCYTIRFYLTDPENLTTAGRNSTCEVADGVYVYIGGQLVQLDRMQPIGPVMGNFDLQGCYPRTGNYFIHNFNKCKTCNTFGVFAMYAQGWLVGFGFGTPGTGSPGPTRDWYENPRGKILDYVIPNAAPCVFDIVAGYNYTLVHVFLVDNPQDISCRRCDDEC